MRAQTDGVVVLDAGGRIVFFGEVATELTGIPSAQAMGRPLWSLVPEEYRAPLRELLAVLVAGSTDAIGHEEHIEVLRGDGSRMPIALRIDRLTLPPEEGCAAPPPMLVATLADLGARRLSREAHWYREVFDQAMIGIALVETTGRFLWVNRRVCEILGCGEDEIYTHTFQDLTHPDHVTQDLAGVRAVLAGERPFYETEKRYVRPDGAIVWVHLWTRALRDEAGDPRYLVSILENIDTRKRAEGADRSSLSLLRATLESTADGILVVDRKGKIVSYNRRFFEMWRVPESRLQDDQDALASVVDQIRDPQGFIERVRDLYARPEAEVFDVVEFKDGRTFERFSKPQMLDGAIVGRVWSFRDVTPRREAEERLLRSQELLAHAQKMEAMGRLAGSVAHDFNNLLAVILGYAGLLAHIAGSDPRHAEWVGSIADAARSAAGLTAQLLAFSRKQPRQLAVLDLNRVVHALEEMLRRLLDENISIETDLAPDLWPVLADRSQMEQVVINLAVNARDAMTRGGVLRIVTSNVRAEGAPDAVRIEVSDSGAGMDAETMSRIFEPFFTTKGPGHGTGLGLSTAHGIVEQSGGTITVTSERERGTTFTILLPSSPPSTAEPPIPRPAREKPKRGDATILLVEDQRELRELVRVILSSHGYRVLVAETQDEALELARQERVDLLLADVVLPRSSGPEIYEALRAEHPDLAVLYVSGYAELHGRAVFDPDAPFLAKPFTPDEIAQKVREVLEGA